MMKWGVAVNVHEQYQQTIELASLADAAELNYIWIVDFPAPRFAPAIAAKIASMTGSSRIGIGLLPSLIYEPDYVVRFAETLATEFGERFDLLIGPGDKEALGTIGKKEWVPGKVARKTVDNALKIKHGLEILDIDCPVWLAAQGPKMIAKSMELDGVLLNLTDSQMIKWALNILDERSTSFRVGIFSPTKLTKVEDTPSSDFLYSAAIVALGASQPLMQHLGFEDVIQSARQIYSNYNKLSPRVLEEIGVENLLKWGFFSTPDKLVQSINQLGEIGVDTTIFGPPISHTKESVNLLLTAFGIYRDSKD
ncbi:MAG: hypothetical protein P1Q69_07930 [Candidatus Thorarchaeota archaeon]|nr:hypothetical protein [Candidatus Thorarchaeota archaeon]